MKFDGTISLGSIIALVVMLLALHQYHMANVRRFIKIEFRVGQMWGVFKRRFGMPDDDPFYKKDDSDTDS
jgi:hypothetical protein